MLSLIISAVAAIATTGTLFATWPGHPTWSVVFGILVFVAVTVIINLLLKKKLETAFNQVQGHIMATQERLMRKIKTIGPRATPKFQQDIEKEQAQSLRDAIAMLDILKPYEKWNFMVSKQTDTLKAQFYFQLKEYAEADKYFKHALLMDPLLMAMQMTRHYKNGNQKELEKCFDKGVRRFKDDKAVIIYALYSWILVQQNKIDEAIQILVQAKTKAENDTLKQNWDHLVNGRVKRFSNAPLGDQWYALMLETPRQQRITQQGGGFGGFGGGFRRR